MAQCKKKVSFPASSSQKKLRFFNSLGVSLVELMIAVAIVGILMMIAVPSYQGFQERARQKGGFNQLNAFYSAAQATRSEFGVFPGNLVQTGYQPTGELNYRLRSNDGTDINLPINDNTCWNTDNANPCDCGGDCPNFKTWREIPFSGGAGLGIGCVICYPCGGVGPLSTTDAAFVVGVSGYVSTRSGLADVYYMNEQKVIENCQDGLK